MKSHLSEFIELMKRENLDEIVIRTFSNYYRKLLAGSTGKLSESEISPPDNVIDYYSLKDSDSALLDKLAVIKLNGGLGTSMGLKKAKSLLRVKGEYNFLDIIALQVLHLRKSSGRNIPLLFMNSFNTRKDTLSYLKKYPELSLPDLPLDFIQSKFPKILQKGLSPLKNLHENSNWNPPGHGEIYSALEISGVLDKLLDSGIEYAFISNSDNLGAVVNEKILNYIADENIPFLMEVCTRTEMDKKGGHLAQTKDGQLILRESAQCPETEIAEFQDINKYSYFNTNNLWVDLKVLKQELINYDSVLPLSMIVNPKKVAAEKVFQIESAMGAAINVFEGSRALSVGRERFAPVKKTHDLLTIWSDIYNLQDDYTLVLEKSLDKPPIVELNEKYYKTIEHLEEHFRKGTPSLKECRKLQITADVFFGENVMIKGDVTISKDGKIENTIVTKRST